MAESGCLKDVMAQNLQVSGLTKTGTLVSRRNSSLLTDAGGAGAIRTAIRADEAGTIFLVPALTSGTQTLELPPAADCVGATFTFVAVATAAQDFNVGTNGSEKIVGATADGDGNNTAISQAYDTVGFDANAVIGTRFSVTCISSTAGYAFIAHDILDGLAANTGSINFA
jgi:hypothetical protein